MLLGTEAVYSDHEDWDSFWLRRLFDTVGFKQEPSVVDIKKLLEHSKKDTVDRLSRSGDPYTHRALDDARLNRQAVIQAMKCRR